MKSKNSRPRYYLLDEFRGFLVLCLIVFHGFYNGWLMFGYDFFGKCIDFFMPVQPFFPMAFIGLCGFCSIYSHSNALRGVKVLLAALGVTAVTWVIDRYFGYDVLILFGVLHLLAFCLLTSALLKKPLSKLPPKIFAAVSLLLFILTYHTPDGYFGVGSWRLALPEALTTENRLFFVGFINSSFTAADYFPLLPWIFIFLFGWFLGRATGGNLPAFFKKPRVGFLRFLGKHAFLIYIVHQPIWFVIFTAFDFIKGLFV